MDELEIIQFHQLRGLNVFVNTVNYRSPHFHREWELLLVLDAPLKAIWQQQEYILAPGDLALFPPRIPHEFQQTDGICTFLCLQIDPVMLSLSGGIVSQDIHVRKYFSRQQYAQLRRNILQIAEGFFRADTYYPLLCYGKSALVMYELLKVLPSRTMSPEEAANESQQNARLMRLADFVEKNYRHKIRLADFAKSEGCSVSYLSHFIRKTMNQTFQEYVNSVRFSHACNLIAEGKLSMISVSVESGFSDYRYFSQAFQKAFGMTPAEYSRTANTVITDHDTHIPSAHSQERFLTRGQSLGILQHYRKQFGEEI